jgi:PmbA protein
VPVDLDSTGTGFLVEALAEDAGETQVAWAWTSRRFGRDVDSVSLADEVAESAVRALGAKPLPSGPYTVLIQPRVGVQLMSLLIQALSAEAVQLNRSFLNGEMNKKVVSDKLTFTDDPLRADGVNSTALDDEGVVCRPRAMIDRGVLSSYFYDLRAARRAGVEPTGHGFRPGPASQPGPHATNFYLAPGSVAVDEMIKADKQVFVLHDVMGLHMADPITGEFSLGASGFLYKNGVAAGSVRGVTIAGTVRGLLSNVQAVGSDLTWVGSLGTPSLLVGGVTISGS